MHDGKDAQRLINQLKKHALAIALGSPSQKYNLGNKSHRVLSVLEVDGTKRAVLARIRQENLFTNMPNHFLFKSVSETQEDTLHQKWHNLKGEEVDFI